MTEVITKIHYNSFKDIGNRCKLISKLNDERK
jgi:hypothetical protein